MTGVDLPVFHNTVSISDHGIRGREVRKLSADDAVATSSERSRRKPHGVVQTHFPCSEDAFAVEIWDGRNSGEFQFGDQVIIDPRRAATPGRMVLASVGPTRIPVFAKYTAATEPGGRRIIVLEPLNPDWERITLAAPDDGEIIGTMTEHARPAR